jgi:hypothetical protein
MAIAALLSEPTIEAAAHGAGVGTRSLYRWLQTPAFREAYRQARREVVSHGLAQLQHACAQAVTCL